MDNSTDQAFKPAPMPQRERALVIGFGVLLVVQGWNLGGVRIAAEFINAFVVFCLLVMALLPLRDDASLTPLQFLRKVGSWGLFWIGLLYLSYVMVQNLNPALQAEILTNRRHILHEIAHNSSLPTGIDAPYGAGNGWRLLLNHTYILIALCVFYGGVSKRRSLMALGWVQIINGTAVALWGVIQRVLGLDGVFGFVHASNHGFFSTFVYPNHAGIYCYVTLGIALAWALIYLRQWGETGVGKRLGILLGCAGVLVIGIVLTYSRVSWLMMLLLLMFGSGGLMLTARGAMRWVVVAGLVVMLGLGSILVAGLVDQAAFSSKVGGAKQTLERVESNPRFHVYKATWEMFEDRPAFGWGTASYRYAFVPYQKRYEQIWDRIGNRVFSNARLLWRYAHNDWLEMLAELGIVGVSVVLSWFAFLAYSLFRHWRCFNMTSLLLMMVVVCVFFHGFFDFIRPANGVTLLFFWVGVLALKYLQWRDEHMLSR